MRRILASLFLALASVAGAQETASRDFTGASSHELSATLTATVTVPLTMGCWISPESAGAASPIAIFNVLSSNGYAMTSSTLADIVYCTAFESLGLFETHGGSHDLTTDKWNWVSCSWDGANMGSWSGDGLTLTTAVPDAYTIDGGAVDEIWAGSVAGSQFWDGEIAHCAVWDVELTDNDQEELARGLYPYLVRPDDLIGYWPIMGDFSPEQDKGDNNDPLTVTGAVAAAVGPPVHGK